EIPRIDKALIKVDSLIWDLDYLQQTPDFEYLDSTSKVREILFEGPGYQGKATKVFAFYSNPDILKTGKNKGNKFPGVVLISGGDQDAMSEWVERWAYEGYAAITCDFGNNMRLPAGGPTSSMELIYDSISKGPQAVRAYRTAAISVLAHSLLLSFPEVEKGKTAVTGISWGGFQTCIVSGIDNRFKAAAPVYGCAFHDEIIFKKYLDERMTPEGKALWMSKIDPKNYLIFSQCPTLFINGNKDGCFDIIPFDKTTKLIPEKNRHIRITPNMGHDHPAGWQPGEIAAFFNSIFNGGIPLPKITGFKKQAEIITFNYESALSLKSANFWYSNDTIHINAERLWKSITAKISDGKIECSYPAEGFLMGFLYVNDVMDLGISSELIKN
ncbi:MAG TPA: dienelactone hydrolase family protein, partial [Draconibacterium sp.]|nr:dienelactone hydrolase family protein [Draconibacterium sp.]